MASLTFLPINLEQDLQTAWNFRQERIAPDVEPADAAPWKTPEDLKTAILKKQQRWNPCVFHIWQDNEIVGQIETDINRFKPNSGYINFYYLIPSLRHHGLGNQLAAFTDSLFRPHGFTCVQLITSPGNLPARAFYQRHGYTEVSPPPEYSHLLLLEKPL